MILPIKRSKLILSFVFIIAGFSIMTIFIYFIPFSPSDIFTIWFWAILVASTFALAGCIVLNFDIKKTVGVIAFSLFCSLIFLVPFPPNIRGLVQAFWLPFLVFLMWLYKKYKENKRK